jgi:DNA-binding HxlR family transcriptional regulator
LQEGTKMNLSNKKDTKDIEASKCPDCSRINEVLSRVGDRWSILVIISLTQYGTLRFNELKRNLGISQRMLSLTLRELERDGLVNRKQYPTIPPKVEYSLTPMGKSFCEPVTALGYWALENLNAIDKARNKFDMSAK